MKNTLQGRRSLTYLFFFAALAVCVCLQIIIASVQPQSLLAVLASLFHAPGYVSYPYGTSMQVTLLSSPTSLYAGAVPNSFELRAGDGAVVQKVPENLFAIYNDILYTDTFAIDSQNVTPQVKAVRESDGKALWSYSSANLNGAQLINGMLFFTISTTSQQQGIVQARDPISGRLLWQYSCSAQDCSVTFPQVQQGITYLVARGSSNSTLLALRASDGKFLWQTSQYIYASQPLLTADRLLIRTAADTFTTYRATDGRMLWQVHVASNEGIDVLDAISNGAIDLISSSNILYAFNATSGALLWQRQNSPFDMQMNSTTIYLSEAAGLLALNAATGQQMWQQIYPPWAIHPTNHNSEQRNIILGEANGKLYMLLKGSQNGYTTDGVFAYNAADGQLVWQRLFTLPSTLEMSAPNGGQAYVAGSDMVALLDGNTIYFTGYEAVTTIEYFRMTLSVNQALNSFFNMTTFTLYSEALDGQTGSVKWQNQQVEQFHVA